MRRFAPGMMVALLLFALPAHAAPRDEDPAEAMVRHIAKDLRCAVCQNQSVYESNSELARDMLGIIRDKVRAGEKEEVIRDYFFQRYGDYIYLEPTSGGMNRLLWGAPFLGLLLGAVALRAAVRRWRKNSAQPAGEPTATPPMDAEMKARIQRELDEVRM